MSLLARRDHSQSELLRKLHQKHFNDIDIIKELNALAEEGFLNETRFIESYIYHRRAKGYGPLRIKAELSERGISDKLIEHHLNVTDNAWLEDVHFAWRKRFKNILPRDYKTRVQQARFLQYRGFTLEQIDSIFQRNDFAEE